MTAALPASDLRQLIPVADAIGATHHNSRRAFYAWAKRYNVRPHRWGQFKRADIDAGLALEERLKGIRKPKQFRTPPEAKVPCASPNGQGASAVSNP
jgi:hypothetical protein